MDIENQDLSSTISNHPIFLPSHFSDDSDTPLLPKEIKSKFRQFDSRLVSFSSSLKTLSSEQKAMTDRIEQSTLSPEGFETLKNYFIQNEETKSELIEDIDSLGEQLSNMEGIVLQLSTDMNKKVDEKFSQVDEKFSQVDEKISQVDEKFSKFNEKIDKKFSVIDRKIDEKFSIMFVVQMISILFSIIAISHH